MKATIKAKARVNFSAFLEELGRALLCSRTCGTVSPDDLRVEDLWYVRSQKITIWYVRQKFYAWLMCGRLV